MRALAEDEYRFDRVDEKERWDCLDYEIERIRAVQRREEIMDEASGYDEDNIYQFVEMVELQRKLDGLKRFERPWLTLRARTKKQLAARPSPPDPVCLTEELSSRARNDSLIDLRVTVDFSFADTSLADSFEKLVKRMRKEGKAPPPMDRRGRPAESAEFQLFALAVYRCLNNGLTRRETWRLLTPLRNKFFIGRHHEKHLDRVAEKIERLVDREAFFAKAMGH